MLCARLRVTRARSSGSRPRTFADCMSFAICDSDGMQWTILVVDDREVARLGLRALFASQRDFIVIGEAATVADAILNAARLHPMLVITQSRLPDGRGIDVCRQLSA